MNRVARLGLESFERLNRESALQLRDLSTYIMRQVVIRRLKTSFFDAQSDTLKLVSRHLRSFQGVCIFDDEPRSLIMLLPWMLRVLAIAYEASASPLSGAGNQVSRVTLPPDVSHLTFSSNLSITPSNISTTNALDIRCDGAQYGDNLNVTDCKDAKAYISSGSEQFPWVDRETLFLRAHFSLPYRFMGGKYQIFPTLRLVHC